MIAGVAVCTYRLDGVTAKPLDLGGRTGTRHNWRMIPGAFLVAMPLSSTTYTLVVQVTTSIMYSINRIACLPGQTS